MCFLSSKICYNAKNCVSNEIENIFIELFILETKPITVEIIYKPPDQSKFLETLSESLNTLNILNKEWQILEDLNINLYKSEDTDKVLSEAIKYLEFCKTFGFKQIILSQPE